MLLLAQDGHGARTSLVERLPLIPASPVHEQPQFRLGAGLLNRPVLLGVRLHALPRDGLPLLHALGPDGQHLLAPAEELLLALLAIVRPRVHVAGEPHLPLLLALAFAD